MFPVSSGDLQGTPPPRSVAENSAEPHPPYTPPAAHATERKCDPDTFRGPVADDNRDTGTIEHHPPRITVRGDGADAAVDLSGFGAPVPTATPSPEETVRVSALPGRTPLPS